MGKESAFQNFNIVRIFVAKFGKEDHQSRQKYLTDILVGLGQAAREPQGDGCSLFVDLHRRCQTQHIVDGGLYQTNCTGDSRTDDVFAFFGVAAVACGVR